MSADLIARLRATSYLRHRGPDYEPLPVPPSALALEAADALDAAKDQLRYFGELHEKEFRASEARVTALEKVLEWYGEQARLCRLIHSEGDAGRHALADDGGKRALAALSPKLGEEK